jgi:hypothetical protein
MMIRDAIDMIQRSFKLLMDGLSSLPLHLARTEKARRVGVR